MPPGEISLRRPKASVTLVGLLPARDLAMSFCSNSMSLPIDSRLQLGNICITSFWSCLFDHLAKMTRLSLLASLTLPP
jgi:hypothetical protein